jgi:hypothetical protein
MACSGKHCCQISCHYKIKNEMIIARPFPVYHDLAPEGNVCDCGICHYEEKHISYRVFKCHFARDPSIQEEFFRHYMSIVRFRWIDEDEVEIYYLPALLNLLASSGYLKYLKHLTISLEQIYTPLWHKDSGEIRSRKMTTSMRASSTTSNNELVSSASCLRTRWKADLTISETSETREPFLKRLEQLSKSTSRRDVA